MYASYHSNLFHRLCKQKIQPKTRMNRVIVVTPVAERNNKSTSTKSLGLNSTSSLEAKLKPIEAGSPMRIGVLATNAILNAGFYQDKLQKEVVLPLRAVNTIILASDDLQDILPYDDTLLKKCVYPVDSLARSTVKLAQSAIQSF
ncbi:probable amino-acid racemase [Tanacetum coccineum]